VIGQWVDFSSGRPSGASLAAAGITGVFGYCGIGSAGKRLTVAEVADMRAHGIQVRGVVESTTTEDDNGYNAGVADARAALADPVTAGLPFIYMVNDKPTYLGADLQYAAGFTSIIGSRSGAYGFASFLTAVRAQGGFHSYLQAGDPPSRTGTESWMNFWQRQGTPGSAADGPASPAEQTIDGVVCDFDNQLILEDTAMTTPASPWDGAYPTNTPEAQWALSSGIGTLSTDGTQVLITVPPNVQGLWTANSDARLALIADEQLPAVAAQLTALAAAVSSLATNTQGAIVGLAGDIAALASAPPSKLTYLLETPPAAS
jgi:Domain of unknown function (DUF1906)